MFQALDSRMCEHAGERKNPCRLGEPSNQRDGPAAVPCRKIYGLVDAACGRAVLDQLLQIANARDLRETPLVDARLKAILERDHQLDAFERAQAELLEGGRSAERAAVRESFEQGFECVAVAAGALELPRLNPVTDRAALQFLVPSVRGSSDVGQIDHVRMR